MTLEKWEEARKHWKKASCHISEVILTPTKNWQIFQNKKGIGNQPDPFGVGLSSPIDKRPAIKGSGSWD